MHETEVVDELDLEPSGPIDCGPASPCERPRPAPPSTAPMVHWASWEGELVALDLRRDRYLALGPGASRAASRALRGEELANEDETLLRPLSDQGLLVAGVRPAEAARGGGVSVPAWRPWESELAAAGVRPPVAWVARALLLIRAADRTLRRQGLGALVERLRQEADRTAGDGGTDEDALRLVAAHARARLVWGRAWEALPAAAALGLHAWRLGLPARVVLGVQKYPFHARAWVEHAGLALADAPEVRERLAPILVVERRQARA